MKKKLIAASMAAAMTLSLAACGGSGASNTASAGEYHLYRRFYRGRQRR